MKKNYAIEGTGIFATDEQVKEAQRPVHHAAYFSGMEPLPTEKVVRMAFDAGVEPREDGKTRIALDVETREFLYAVPSPDRERME